MCETEITFHPYGPGEQFTLVQGADSVVLAEVDVDDVCVPRFPLRDLPDVAAFGWSIKELHRQLDENYLPLEFLGLHDEELAVLDTML